MTVPARLTLLAFRSAPIERRFEITGGQLGLGGADPWFRVWLHPAQAGLPVYSCGEAPQGEEGLWIDGAAAFELYVPRDRVLAMPPAPDAGGEARFFHELGLDGADGVPVLLACGPLIIQPESYR